MKTSVSYLFTHLLKLDLKLTFLEEHRSEEQKIALKSFIKFSKRKNVVPTIICLTMSLCSDKCTS